MGFEYVYVGAAYSTSDNSFNWQVIYAEKWARVANDIRFLVNL